jgi:hypothetical protein
MGNEKKEATLFRRRCSLVAQSRPASSLSRAALSRWVVLHLDRDCCAAFAVRGFVASLSLMVTAARFVCACSRFRCSIFQVNDLVLVGGQPAAPLG